MNEGMNAHQGGGKEEGRSFGIGSRFQSGGLLQLPCCMTVIFSQLPRSRLFEADLAPERALVLTLPITEEELTKASTIKLNSLQ